MFIDITFEITPKLINKAQMNENKAFEGHLGTHFDVMNKDFPLDYIKRNGILFDVTDVLGDIDIKDIDMGKIKKDMFVAFYSGYIDKVEYGSSEYFKDHPQLSIKLIDQLLNKKVSIIGVDFAGVRRGDEHTPMDQYCADKGIFIIENLCNLKAVLKRERSIEFCANTYPMKYTEMTGLPCRVVAEVSEELC